jgi:hypothetical protein
MEIGNNLTSFSSLLVGKQLLIIDDHKSKFAKVSIKNIIPLIKFFLNPLILKKF